jgi:hypothetical protein
MATRPRPKQPKWDPKGWLADNPTKTPKDAKKAHQAAIAQWEKDVEAWKNEQRLAEKERKAGNAKAEFDRRTENARKGATKRGERDARRERRKAQETTAYDRYKQDIRIG